MDKVDIDTTVNPIMDMNSNKLIEGVWPRSSVDGGTKQLKPVRKGAKDATPEYIDRVVSHIVKKDLEQGYPCQHR